jgi:hypothetical protein
MGRGFEAEAALRAQLVLGEHHERFGHVDRTIAAVRAPQLLAELLLHLGRIDDADAVVRGLIATRPAYGFAWLTLAEASLAKREDDRFEAILHKLGASDDSEVARIVLRAARLRRDNEPQRAARLVQEGLVTRPGHVALRTALVLALFASGERGARLQHAIDDALAGDPFCMRTWAVLRETGGHQSLMLHRVAGSSTAIRYATEESPWQFGGCSVE